MKKYPKRHPLCRGAKNLCGVAHHPFKSNTGKGDLGLFQGCYRDINNERISTTFSIGRLGEKEALRQAEEYVLRGKLEYHLDCIKIIREEFKKRKRSLVKGLKNQ